MSSHRRSLEAATRLADELVVDLLFLMHRRPWYRLSVTAGVLAGLSLGLLAGSAAPRNGWFLTVSCTLVLTGLGMNIGAEFRFLAATTTRVLLVRSSRISSHPVRPLREVLPERLDIRVRGPFLQLTIDGERHVTGRQHLTRLRRMPGLRLPTG